MKLKKTGNLKLLGKGELLIHLQSSISQVTRSILIVGPWLDAYFVRKVLDSLPSLEIEVRFLVRIEEEGEIDSKTKSALNLARKNISNFKAKTLKNLHSKVIIIDNNIFYLGSTNWYWYSLNESLEATITGKISYLPELMTEMDDYWEKATPLTADDLKGFNDFEPIKVEVHLK
jgi:phosphatidylserine/phosphatidylglycerophosphate/cardiolipin synthase-like enzyme